MTAAILKKAMLEMIVFIAVSNYDKYKLVHKSHVLQLKCNGKIV